MIAAAVLGAAWCVLIARLPSGRSRAFSVLGSLLFVGLAFALAVWLTPGTVGSALLEESARWLAVGVAVLGGREARVLAALSVGLSLGIAESVLAHYVSPSGLTDLARLLVALGLHAPLAVWFCGPPRRSLMWLPLATVAHVTWNGFVSETDALALSATAAAIVSLSVVAARDAHRQR